MQQRRARRSSGQSVSARRSRKASQQMFAAALEALEGRQLFWGPPQLDYGYVTGTYISEYPPAEWGEANEGASIGFEMGFTDYDGDPISVDIYWGDGSSDTYENIGWGSATLSVSHTYQDQGEWNYWAGNDFYQPQINFRDDNSGWSNLWDPYFLVHNVAPTGELASNGPVAANTPIDVWFSYAWDDGEADRNAGLHFSFATDTANLAGDYWSAADWSNAQITFTTPGTYTVYGRVFDKDGAYNDYSTSVTITPAAPTATFSNNGPVNEGSAAQASFSNVSSPSGLPVRYSFATNPANLASTYSAAGTSTTQNFNFADNGNYTLYGRIIDSSNSYTDYSTVVNVKNVSPTLTLTGPSTVSEGSTYTLQLGSSDPGPDTITSWLIDWGDGTSPQTVSGNPSSIQHTYTDGAKNVVIIATATDEDGTHSASPAKLDVAFGTNGTAQNPFTWDPTFTVRQPDGKFLIGYSQWGNSFMLTRYSANGTLDTTFGTNGTAAPAFPNSFGFARHAVVQTDGKIIVVGHRPDYSLSGHASENLTVARYNTNGTLDTTFGTGGLASAGFGGYESSSFVALQPSDGKILVVGQYSPSGGGSHGTIIARFNTNGTLDTTYGTSGATILTGDWNPTQFAMQSDGKAIIANTGVLRRINTNGTLDTGFGTSGQATFSLMTNFLGLALQADNKIVVVGAVDSNASRVARFTANGALDTSFNSTGSRVINHWQSGDMWSGLRMVTVVPDGRIVASGLFGGPWAHDFGFASINPDGSMDRKSAGNGTWSMDYGGDEFWPMMVSQPDGKIVVAYREQAQEGAAAYINLSRVTLGTGKAVTVINVARSVSISGNSSAIADKTYTLNLSSTDPGQDTVSSWTINWGDGTTTPVSGNPATVTHSYAAVGQYTITASATDEDGTWSSGNTVAVTVTQPYYVRGLPTIQEGSPYTLYLSGPATTSSWQINWGDGNVQTVSGSLTSVSHTYADAGNGNGGNVTNYIISATATDGGQTYTARMWALDPAFVPTGNAESYGFYDGPPNEAQLPNGQWTTVGAGGPYGETPIMTSPGGDILLQFDIPVEPRGAALHPGGYFIVAGHTMGWLYWPNQVWDFAWAPFASDGSMLWSQAATTNFGGDETVNGVTVQSDGRVLLVGNDADGLLLACYNTDGSLDTTFGFGGSLKLSGSAYGAAIQTDGSVVTWDGVTLSRYAPMASGVSLQVTNVAPTATMSNNGPINEGGSVHVTVNNPSDPAAADLANLRYSFALTTGGLASSYSAAGTSPFADFTFTDSGIKTIYGRVWDDDGGWSNFSTTAIVTNVAPTATFSGDPGQAGVAITVRLTNPLDPSIEDTNAGFHYSFATTEAGLASTYSASGTNSTHQFTFENDGIYTVWGRIIDKNNGKSTYSISLTVVTLTATSDSNAPIIYLSWPDIASGETGWQIQRSNDGTQFQDLQTLPANSTAFNDSNVQDGVQYWYRVKPLTAQASYSPVKTAITMLRGPDQVTVVRPDASIANAVISWRDNSSSESGFKIYISVDGGSFSEFATAGPNTTSKELVSLPAGTNHTFRVQAYNGLVSSAMSDVATSARARVMYADLEYETAPHKIQFEFDRNVSAFLNASSVKVYNLTTGEQVPPSQILYSYDAGTNTATFTFNGEFIEGFPSGMLPEGNYRAVLTAKYTGAGGTEYIAAEDVYDFYFYFGDIDRNRIVDADDWTVLLSYFGTPSGAIWSTADMDYNGIVDTVDVSLVQMNYGTSFSAPPDLVGAVAATSTSTSEIRLTWSDNIVGEAGWRVQRSSDGVHFDWYHDLPANSTQWTNAGLSEGQRFWYRVRAFGNGKDTKYTQAQMGTAQLLAPHRVSIVPNDPVAGQTRIRWQNRSQTATSIRILQSTDGGPAVVIATYTPAVTEHIVEGLSAGHAYTFQVQAYTDADSFATSAETPMLWPSATGITAIANFIWDNVVGEKQKLTITFSEDVGASLSVSDFILENITTNTTITPLTLVYNSATKTATLTWPTFTSPNSWNAPGVLADGNYQLRMLSGSVQNGSGSQVLSQDLNYEFFFLNGDANRDRNVNILDMMPMAQNFLLSGKKFSEGDFNYDGTVNQSDLTVLSLHWIVQGYPGSLLFNVWSFSPNQVNLSWDDVATGEQGWRVQRAVNGGAWETYVELPADSTHFEDQNVAGGNHYWYRVQAFGNGADTVYTPKKSAAILATPTAITATPVSNTRMDLAWMDNSNAEAGFEIERSDDGGYSWNIIGTTGPNVVTYNDRTIPSEGAVIYRIRALDGTGSHSAYAQTAASFTKLAAPTRVNAMAAAGGTSATITWRDNSQIETGYVILQRTNGGSFQQIGAVAGNTTSFTVTGLTTANRYTFIVRAIRTDGREGSSIESPLQSTANINVSGTFNYIIPAGNSIRHHVTLDFGQEVLGIDASDILLYNLKTGTVISGAVFNYDSQTHVATLTFPTSINTISNGMSGLLPDGNYSLMIPANSITTTAGVPLDQDFNLEFFFFSGDHNHDRRVDISDLYTMATNWFMDGKTFAEGDYDYNFTVNQGDLTVLARQWQVTLPEAFLLNAWAVSPTQINLSWDDQDSSETSWQIERSVDGQNFVTYATLGMDVHDYTDVNVVAGARYWYRIRPLGGSVASYSTVKSVLTPAAPAAPSSLSVTAVSDTRMDLAWSDNSNLELGFRIERSTDGITWTLLANVGENITSFSDTSVTETVSPYYYRVYAFNAVGQSASSGVVSANSMLHGPSGVALSFISGSRIDIFWTDNSSVESGYVIEQSLSPTFGTIDALYNASANAVSFQMSGPFSAGVTYFFRVRANADGRTSAYSNTVSYTTPALPSPGTLAGTVVSGTEINLDWSDPASDEDGYEILRSTDGINFAVVATLSTSATSLTVTGLASNTTYYFKLRSYNVMGSSHSNVVSVTTSVLPSAPSSLSPTAVTNTRIDLTWADNSGNEAGFKIERSDDGGQSWNQIFLTGANTTSYSDTTVSSESSVKYRIRAFNAAGNSAYNSTNLVSTRLAAPTNPSATFVSSTRIDIAWTDNSSHETGYTVEQSTTPDFATFQAYGAPPNSSGLQATGPFAAGTTYYFRIRASVGGTTSVDVYTSAVTTPALPAAPTGLSGLPISGTQVNLSWNDNADNEQGYEVQRSIDNVNFTSVGTTGAGMANLSASGLTMGTTYYFRVRAFNASGNSGFSNVISVTTLAAPAAPASPSALATSSTAILVQWSDNSSNELGFNVYRASTAGGPWTLIGSTGANQTSFPNSGLTDNTTYYYRVTSFNAVGESSPSSTVSATTPLDTAAAPTGLVATALGSNQISLVWNDNATNEQNYHIEQSTNGIDFTPAATVAMNASSFVVSGLAANVTYTFRVRASNNAGFSGYSNTAFAQTIAVGTPSNLTATPGGNGTIVLTWNDNSSNEQGFQVEKSIDGGANFTVVTANTGQNATSYIISTGLNPGIQYHFRVRAFLSATNSAYSNVASATTTSVLPAAPSGLTASALIPTSIRLSWFDNSDIESGYKLERSTDGISYSLITPAPSAGYTSWDVSSLSPNTLYYFRLRTTSTAGDSAYSNVATATTPSASAPYSVSTQVVSSSRIDVSWGHDRVNVQGFRIEKSTDGVTYQSTGTAGALASNFQMTGLSAGTVYFIRVIAYSATADSMPSNVVKTRSNTIPSAPSNLTAVAGSNTQVNLSWTDNSDNEAGFKIEQSNDGSTWTQLGITTITTYNVNSNLQPNTSYYFRVRAFTWWWDPTIGDNSAYSNTATVTTTARIPDAPSQLTVTAVTNNSVSFSWTDISDNEDGFRFYRSTDGVNFTEAGTAGVNSQSFTISSLIPGTTYQFKTRAFNGVDYSPYSNTITVTTHSIPQAPSGLTVTPLSNTELQLNWADNSNNETQFNIYRGTSPGSLTLYTTTSNNVATYKIQSLTANTLYYFKVLAQNSVGLSGDSNVASATTLNVTPPTNLVATVQNNSNPNVVQLTWADNTSNETGYQILRSTDGVNFVPSSAPSANWTSATETVSFNTTYYYRIFARTPSGDTAQSNTAIVTMPPLAGPVSVGVTPISSSRIDLSWSDTANEQGYRIEQSSDGVTYSEIATSIVNATSYSVTGLNPLTRYYFRIRAYNPNGNSLYSNPNNTRTYGVPATPSSLSATASSNSQITLTWTDNSSTEAGYKVERSTNGVDFTQITTQYPFYNYWNDTSLTPGTTYYYRIRAYTGDSTNGDNSAYSSIVSATTRSDVPTAPVSLTAVAQDAKQVTLTWIDTTNTETAYKIEQSTDGVTFTEIYNNAGSPYTVYELAEGTTYYFRVRAYNNAGNSGYSNVATVTTPQIDTPYSLYAASYYSNQIKLNWSFNGENQTGFRIEKSTDGVNFTEIGTAAAAYPYSYSATSLPSNTLFYFRVRAYNGTALSPYSSVIMARTKGALAAPSGLTASPALVGQINLAWTDNSQDEAYFKIYRSTDGTNFAFHANTSANQTSTVISGTAGTTYYFQVRAFDGIEESVPSNTASAVAGSTVPAAPTGLAATVVSNVRIDLTWTNNADNVQGFKVGKSTDGINFTEVTSGSSYSATGLTVGTTYYFRVRAYNAAGDSAYSNIVIATTGSYPVAPNNFVATVVSTNQINLTWADQSSNETDFQIERRADGIGSWIAVVTLGANVTSYNNTGLTPEAAQYYQYQIRSINGSGNSSWTQTGAVYTKPNAPISATATFVSGSQITVNWADSSNRENGYYIEQASNAAGPWINVGSVSTNVTTYQATGPFNPSTPYYFRVRANNSGGYSDYSPTASVTSPAFPSAPNGLTVSGASASTINLSWADNSNETGYSIERSVNGYSGWTQIGTTSANIVTYVDNGLAEATTYYYRVTATNGAGSSSPSTAVNGLTRPAAPSAVNVTFISPTQITVGWTNNSNGASGFKIEQSLDGTTFTQIGTSFGTTFQGTGPFNGSATYYFRVKAYNSSGDSTASAAGTTTTAGYPNAPSGLTLSVVSSSQINLTWTDNSNNETGFKVERSTDGNTWTPVTTTATNAGGYNDTGLSQGTNYHYRVTATNGSGDSAPATAPSTTTNYNTPTVATPAAANPSPATGTTTNLTVLGAVTGGNESSLKYTWSVTTVPSGGSASFSVNGTNAAKNVTATFTKFGTYVFLVTIANGTATTTSSVSVEVQQTLTSISITPSTARLHRGQSQQFSATAKDQFGQDINPQPTFTWSIDSGGLGTISTTGLYTASSKQNEGSATVRATSGTKSGTATVVITDQMIINFDNLPAGTIVTNQYPGVTFSGDPAYPNKIVPSTDRSQPNSLGAPTPPPEGQANGNPYIHPLYVDFTIPVNGLSFYQMRDDNAAGSTIAQVRVFQNGSLATTLPIISGTNLVDLSATSNITRIEIVNITDAAGLIWDDFSFKVSGVDAQIDSDNNNALNDPDGNTAEDSIEFDQDKPGKIVFVDNSDTDGDGIPDFADGYNFDGQSDTPEHQADDTAGNNLHFAHFVISIPKSVDTGVAKIKIIYDASDPNDNSQIIRGADDRYEAAVGAHRLRIWTKDGNNARDMVSVQNGGTFVKEEWFDASKLTWTTVGEKKRAILYIEGVRASDSKGQQEISVLLAATGDTNNVTIDDVRATAASVAVERKKADGSWEAAGTTLPMYRPTPLIRLPDITDANVSGPEYDIPQAQSQVFDPITFVSKVEVSIDGGAWTAITLTNQAAPTTLGDPFESRFAAPYKLENLNDLRSKALGTQRRYVFKATDYAGRVAFEEIILRVVFNATTQQKVLHVVNLGAAANEAAPKIPDNQKLRFHIAPVLTVQANDEILNLSTPMYVTNQGGNAAEAKNKLRLLDFSSGNSKEFVILDDSSQDPTTPIPPTQPVFAHFLRDFTAADKSKITVEYVPLPATASNAKGSHEVKAAYFDLLASLTDDSTEDTDAVSVRYNPTTVNAGNFDQYKYLMYPMKLIAKAQKPGGTVTISIDSGSGISIWQKLENGSWEKATLPLVIDDAKLVGADASKLFLICGETKNAIAVVKVSYTFGGKEIQTDRVKFQVRDLPGLAGERLTLPAAGGGTDPAAPYLNYVHSFNAGDAVTVGLDPFTWSQISKHLLLPTVDADKTSGTIYVVPHRAPADWATDQNLTGITNSGTSGPIKLSGDSLKNNLYQAWPAANAGSYDVVFDLVDDKGDPNPNGRFDPGDIIGKFVVDAKDAEVHVLADPLTVATNPVTNHAAYAVGHFTYGSVTPAAGAPERFSTPAGFDGVAAAITDHYIHGEIYYPALAAGTGTPAASGNFPLVVILHGNHTPLRHLNALVAAGTITAAQRDAISLNENYLGYTYLQQRLAEMGYVSVSVDLDRYVGIASVPAFAWSYPGIQARAWAGAKNVDYVINHLNAAGSGSPISGHVSSTDITLIGHSRGGEAVVQMANFLDTSTGPFAAGAPGAIAPFAISRVISVAPTANNNTSVGNRPYLALHGSADGDVIDAGGLRLYDTAPGLKAAIFIEGANHNFFNSSWTKNDATDGASGPLIPPIGGALTTRPYQENLLTSYALAWIWQGPHLEYFSRPANKFRPDSLGTTVLYNQFHQPSGIKVLDDFETNIDAGQAGTSSSGGSVGSAGMTVTNLDKNLNSPAVDHYYQATRGAELAWDRTNGLDYYEQNTIAGTRDASGLNFLSFRIGSHYQQVLTQSFTVELTDTTGKVAYINSAELTPIASPYPANATGLGVAGLGDISKMEFQTFRFNLQVLQLGGYELDLTNLGTVRLIFDQTDNGKMAIDDIEFSN